MMEAWHNSFSSLDSALLSCYAAGGTACFGTPCPVGSYALAGENLQFRCLWWQEHEKTRSDVASSPAVIQLSKCSTFNCIKFISKKRIVWYFLFCPSLMSSSPERFTTILEPAPHWKPLTRWCKLIVLLSLRPQELRPAQHAPLDHFIPWQVFDTCSATYAFVWLLISFLLIIHPAGLLV